MIKANLLEWVSLNKEWVFSGVGFSIIGFIGGFIKWSLNKKNEKTSIKIAKDRSNIIGGNVKGNVNSGDQK